MADEPEEIRARASGPAPDTIVAQTTAQGVSGVAVLRLSGPEALSILERLCPELGGLPEPRRATLTAVRDPEGGELLDRALVTVFPGPESYTGEDVVEISGHGGFLAPSLVLEACVAAGARGAEPGEFTRRAYLNGKMDLVQAEAIVDLVEARNQALHDTALHHLERGLSARLARLREELVSLEALLAHHLDFPEEDDPPVPVERVADEAREVARSLERLLETAPEGELLREGAVVVLAGLPNSGKSSLFNGLVGRDRAIVTEVPGTTRDALEALVSVGGFPFRLVDTAGLRESEDRVERLGIEVARRYLERADLILFCVETGRDLTGAERDFLAGIDDRLAILVRTKADLAGAGSKEGGIGEDYGEGATGTAGGGEGGEASVPGAEGASAGGSVRVSVVSGQGLGVLRKLLPRLVYRGLVKGRREMPVVTRRRQARGIREALEGVRAFARALDEGAPAEMAATHLRPAESALEEVLGVIRPDEVLERVFGDFCIGK